MKNIIEIVTTCLAIVFGKKKASHRQKMMASGLISISSVLYLTLTFVFGGFTATTFLYFVCSALKHITEAWANMDTWGMFSSVFYEIGNQGKEWLIENNGIAGFLDACNVSVFGKFVQITCLIVGTVICITIFAIACKSISFFYNEYMENYLMTHRKSWIYRKKLQEFIDTYRSKEYSSKELQRDPKYSVFYCERAVQNLLNAKLKREQSEPIDFSEYRRRRHG